MSAPNGEVLFLADPWDTLDHGLDSTLLLAKAAQARGFNCYWASPENLAFSTEGPMAGVRLIGENCTELNPEVSTRDLRSFESIHWRIDPPVTLETMRLWDLLDATLPPKQLINSARALLTWNEKHAVLRFRDWCIPSLFTNSSEMRREFIKQTLNKGKQVIMKPAGEAASRGVEILPTKFSDAIERAEILAGELGPWPVVQEMDDEIYRGETRIFILGGKIAGSLRKTPAPQTPIMVWEGLVRPTVQPSAPSEIQKNRAGMIGRELKKAGVLFSTIDFIGDRLLEINVTSPGLLHFLGVDESQIFAGWYWDMVKDYLGPT